MNSRSHKVTILLIGCLLGFTITASAATETVVHTFAIEPNGAYPNMGLIADAAGNFYGVTPKGGAHGIVFRLSKNAQGHWTETVLHNFLGGSDGVVPQAGLMLDKAGNLYGTTQGGGVYNCGVAFRLSPTASGPWKESIVHTFACYPVDGNWPSGALISDAAGNLYGVTLEGGAGGCGDGYTTYGCGMVYELSPAGGGAYSETILDSFGTSSNSESNPSGPLAFDSQGNLYGTAETGGNGQNCYYYGCGTVFKLTKGSGGWTESTIYNLTGGADGDSPVSGVFFDAAGNLYGTGAGYYNYGGVFILSPNSDGTWSETSPFAFTNLSGGLWETVGNVALDSSGNIYGAAAVGGLASCLNFGCGGIYELVHGSSGWTQSDLYDFTDGTDGANPQATVLRDSSGNLYTTTFNGGKGVGSVFELSPASSGGWNGKAIYDFPLLTEGTMPYAGLTPDGAGNYYGTTATGGNNSSCGYSIGCGSVFKLSPNGKGGWKETVIYIFTGKNGDGAYPTGNLVFDSGGNLYGTTQTGGAVGTCSYNDYCGTVFKLAPNSNGTWTETVLYAFTGYTKGDGSDPIYGLVLDAAGNLYGTTTRGGTYDTGTVFELSPSSGGTWTETILHIFGGTGDTANPSSPLVMDASGSLYGSTVPFGGGNGAVYRLSLSGSVWTETLLFQFPNATSTGSGPAGNIVFDGEGNLYGATGFGGAYQVGTIYKLTPASSGPWTETVLYSFRGVNGDGSYPQGGVTFDAAGNLYGTTQRGGTYSSLCGSLGCGTVFEVSPTSSGPWHEQVLHRFAGGGDGSTPSSQLVVDPSGNAWGTASAGGSGGAGIVFEIKP